MTEPSPSPLGPRAASASRCNCPPRHRTLAVEGGPPQANGSAPAVSFSVLVGIYGRGSFEPQHEKLTRRFQMSHDRVEDEAAINAMLSEMYQAWADNDADGFVKYYTDDATAILPGSLRGSSKVIRDSMAAGFDGALRGSATIDRQLSLRFVGEDAAVAVSEGGILFAG